MEFGDLARSRTMVRSFSAEPVPREALERIIELACTAPSAGNTGGWDVVVLTGADTAAFWDATTTQEWRARSRRWEGLARAPVVVAVFVDPDAYLERYREEDKRASGLGSSTAAWPVPFWFVDGAFALMLMLLAAGDAGLGACILGNFRGEAALRTALAVPNGRRYVGAVAIGRPEGSDPPSASVARGRRQPADVVHRGRW
jgi:nitroreductase